MFVMEADESDGSFLLYDTAVALITNVDPDHLDHYGTAEAYEAAYVEFASSRPRARRCLADDPGAVRLAAALPGKRILRFGTAADADVRITSVVDEGAAFTLGYAGRSMRSDCGFP